MKGRAIPVIYQPPRASDRSQDVDADYFTRHPSTTEYERAYIQGESPEPMPPDTRVLVKRIGTYQRARAFVPPSSKVN